MTLAQRLEWAAEFARERLLATRDPAGCWRGRLSDSALSTATALSALALAGEERDQPLVVAGLDWLRRTQLPDGSFGDTPESPGNLSTTLLVLSALALHGEDRAEVGQRTRQALAGYDATDPAGTVAAIRRTYGEDRTFAVPILMNAALAGLVPWAQVPGLPFELAALPRSLFSTLRLRVVSYALPALIAIGLLVRRRGQTTAASRLTGALARPRALRLLAALQPPGGGFLEATPLTAFVGMSLAAADEALPVRERCLDFLRRMARPNGAWPIDADLAGWVTSNALVALEADAHADPALLQVTREWLAAGQLQRPHVYTGAAPGAWAWTDLDGAVPDADDTSAALVALSGHLPPEALRRGVRWLLDLQNADGGWPTFCRGWGRLPFDQSCADITAHALRALHAAAAAGVASPEAATRRGLEYLARTQLTEGAWLPLWFGNQHAPDKLNPVLGTSRVLRALSLLAHTAEMTHRGVHYLLAAQHPDGGWGGGPGITPTVEETALALSALADWPGDASDALHLGAGYLASCIEAGGLDAPAPIGLYFSQLWYSEDLYPVAWSLEALARLRPIIDN